MSDSLKRFLALREVDRQRPHVEAVLRRLGHACRDGTGVQLPTLAAQRQSALFDDIERSDGHIDYLAAFPDERIVQWQFMMTTLALSGQRVINVLGRLHGLLECTALVASLTAGWFAGRLAQRTGFLGKAIGRGRLARIVAVLVDLRFECFQARQQRHFWRS